MVAQVDIADELEAIEPTKRDVSTSCESHELGLPPLQVSDDFVGSAPIGPAELEAIETYLSDILDAVFG